MRGETHAIDARATRLAVRVKCIATPERTRIGDLVAHTRVIVVR